MGKQSIKKALKKKANRKDYEKRRNVNRNKEGVHKLITPPSKKNRYKNIDDMNYEEEAKLRQAWNFKLRK